MALASGWGRIDVDVFPSQPGIEHKFPKVLQKALVPIVSRETCISAFWDKGVEPFPDNRLVGSYICTLSTEGKAGCPGDSGGPLVVDGMLVGLDSLGFECGSTDGPEVYTRAPYYTAWIEQVMAEYGDDE